MEALAKYGDMALPPALRSIVAERPCASPAGGPRLLDRVREAIRTRHLSPRTEEAYVFHGKRHPAELGALSALLFLYRRVLNVALPWLDGLVRAKRPVRLPVVLGREEVAAILAHLDGVRWLMAALLYGTGLRLLECLQLRVKDVDLARNELLVRAGKGDRDRRTMLPQALRPALAAQLD